MSTSPTDVDYKEADIVAGGLLPADGFARAALREAIAKALARAFDRGRETGRADAPPSASVEPWDLFAAAVLTCGRDLIAEHASEVAAEVADQMCKHRAERRKVAI